MHGWHGQYLRIDLASGKAVSVPIDRATLSRFVGGTGLGTWIALAEGAAERDPFDPAAPLVFSLSPLVGSPLTTSAKLAVVGRSPLTGMLCDAISSSHFAIAAKRAGFDAYAIVGRAPELSRVIVDGDRCTVVPAPELAGLPDSACELPGFRTAAIGPAGERRVHFATIANDGRHAGRGGLGAILGAKRCKAFSIRGDRPTPIFDPPGAARAARDLARRSRGPRTAKYRELGTVANTLVFDRLDALPTRNFTASRLEGVDNLSAESLHGESGSVRASCASCTIACEHRFERGDGGASRLEYETVFALGAGLGISSPDAVLAAARRCDELGLDTISAGGTLAFAMEAELEGLRFGDADGALAALDAIAERRGIGDLLAGGSRHAAAAVGRPELAMHVKGLELPGYHPARLQAMALGFAVGTRGADHNRSGAYELDFSTELDRLDFDPADAARVVAVENRSAALDSLILCRFLRGVFDDLPLETAELLRLVTGESIDVDRLGARVCSLRKAFNVRAGWRPADDTLPERVLQGTLSRSKLREMIRHYNRARCWSDDGHPSPEHLAGLDIELPPPSFDGAPASFDGAPPGTTAAPEAVPAR